MIYLTWFGFKNVSFKIKNSNFCEKRAKSKEKCDCMDQFVNKRITIISQIYYGN